MNEWCREKVTVDQDWITFQGDGPRLTEIQWGDTATSAGSTFKSASVAVNGDHFTAKDISFRVHILLLDLLVISPGDHRLWGRYIYIYYRV